MSDIKILIKKLTPPKRKRVSLFLAPLIYLEARKECKARGVKISWVIEERLKEFLEECKKSPVK